MGTLECLPVSVPVLTLQFQPAPARLCQAKSRRLVNPPYLHRRATSFSVSALNRRPKGFGSPTPNAKSGSSTSKKKQKKKKKGSRRYEQYEDDEDEEEEEEDKEFEREVAIPEVVTNRMMRRMVFSLGVPLVTGLLFFPFFYYLKVVAKVDVPTWIPLIVSFFFFGTALLGISYGIVSSSWDPLREGSLLGWNEAQRNWPVFWDSLSGRSSSTSRKR